MSANNNTSAIFNNINLGRDNVITRAPCSVYRFPVRDAVTGTRIRQMEDENVRLTRLVAEIEKEIVRLRAAAR